MEQWLVFISSPASAEGSIPVPTHANSTEKHNHHDAHSAEFHDNPGIQYHNTYTLYWGKKKPGETSTNYKWPAYNSA